MLWYIIGGIIGIIFIKDKYNLSFWQAVLSGIIIIFGILSIFSAIFWIFAGVSGFEKPGTSIIAVVISALIAYGSFKYFKSINTYNLNRTKVQHVQFSSDDTYSGNIEGYQPEPGDTIRTPLAGVTFEGRQILIKRLKKGQEVKVEREPTNPYDPNAIKVSFSGEENRVIGYIRKTLAAKISWIIDTYETNPIIGHVTSVYRLKNDPSILGVEISFTLPEDDNLFFTDNEIIDWENDDFECENDLTGKVVDPVQ